ncbi:MAG: sugar transferase [Chloroflexota bacterium]|nr:sugar transferase [Chloroflexota bacterium]
MACGDNLHRGAHKYDLWYIENWSLLLDIKIILRSVLAVFKAKDAY